jgi:catechol 2,3-dioxygenase-like lactoylglutathione lyase family enzyme
VPLTGHATVFLVEDVRRATEYYRDALGFEVDLYDPDHYGYARRDGSHVHFARFGGVTARPNSEVVPGHVRRLLLGRRPRGSVCGAVERGAELVHGPVDQDYGLRELRVRDPDGYILAFGQPLAR